MFAVWPRYEEGLQKDKDKQHKNSHDKGCLIKSARLIEKVSGCLKNGRKTKTRTGLTNMPGVVIIRIVKLLSGNDRAALSYTCTQFWTARKKNMRLLAKKEMYKIPYLWQMSLQMPDHWFCVYCIRLHRFTEGDTPLNPSKTRSCPHRHVRSFCTCGIDELCPYYTLWDRHVQLALKWTRMGIHNDRIKSLVQPFSIELNIEDARVKASVEAYVSPLIVKGRFMLHRRWTYYPGPELNRENERVQQPYWNMRICPHQEYSESSYFAFKEEKQSIHYHYHQRTASITSLSSGGDGGGGQTLLRREGAAICKAVHDGLASPWDYIFTACPLCRTDFCVYVLKGRHAKNWDPNDGITAIVIMAWLDMGGECAPIHPEWASQVMHNNLSRIARFRNNSPGSVFNAFLKAGITELKPEIIKKAIITYKQLMKDTTFLTQQDEKDLRWAVIAPLLYLD
ncbi:hypothetical protein QQS21_008270 [Conoideocrella luteorostrata]|uniref:F-box domain-containing protein n=1 Tax=Conoideocrella luteorostrata TaxID=1105319 RepID=A0AAJ0CJ44_9HYPO|nr:hypothetical protein QQS21_008270 [Conoideocrella luteorostrata]